MQDADEARALLELAETAARRAGEIALGFYGTKVKTRLKGKEPVTEADLAAHDSVLETLADSDFDFPFISEEAADDPQARAQASRFWVLDPIDGTRAFIDQKQGWAVQLGLVENGRAVLGVVYSPAEDLLWRGHVGLGIAERVCPSTGEVVAIRCTDEADPTACTLARSSNHPSGRVHKIAKNLGILRFLTMSGAGAKGVRVADGTLDLYLVTSDRTKIWDVCAPEAIVVAAGGRVTDLRGRPMCYDQPELRNASGILMSNDAVHDTVLEAAAVVMAQSQS